MAGAGGPCYAERMLKLLCLLAFLGGAAAVAWAPVHGRTVLDRWRAAPGPVAFVERAWSEAKSALLGPGGARRSGASQPARASRATPRPARPARPSETYTERDRAALDRIVAEHADH
jgi:hypothetical protein